MSASNGSQRPDNTPEQGLLNGAGNPPLSENNRKPRLLATSNSTINTEPLNTETDPSNNAQALEPASQFAHLDEAPLNANPSWLFWLEKLQKGGIAAASLVYGLGYAVWAYHAWRYNLGALPALQSQYFVAGLIPALLIGLMILATNQIKRFVEAIGTVFLVDTPPCRRRFRPAITAIYTMLCVVSVVLYITDRFHPLSIGLIYLLYLSFSGAALGVPILIRMWDKKLSPKMNFGLIDYPYLAFLPGLIAFILVCVYFRFMFPNVPQELGGALPRIARLDVDRTSLSDERLRALFPRQSWHSKTKVIESEPVFVFFANSQSLIVKPYAPWSDNRAYEVMALTIRGIVWLDRDKRPIREPAHFLVRRKIP